MNLEETSVITSWRRLSLRDTSEWSSGRESKIKSCSIRRVIRTTELWSDTVDQPWKPLLVLTFSQTACHWCQDQLQFHHTSHCSTFTFNSHINFDQHTYMEFNKDRSSNTSEVRSRASVYHITDSNLCVCVCWSTFICELKPKLFCSII